MTVVRSTKRGPTRSTALDYDEVRLQKRPDGSTRWAAYKDDKLVRYYTVPPRGSRGVSRSWAKNQAIAKALDASGPVKPTKRRGKTKKARQAAHWNHQLSRDGLKAIKPKKANP